MKKLYHTSVYLQSGDITTDFGDRRVVQKASERFSEFCAEELKKTLRAKFFKYLPRLGIVAGFRFAWHRQPYGRWRVEPL